MPLEPKGIFIDRRSSVYVSNYREDLAAGRRQEMSRNRVVEVVERWASQHADPDKPTLLTSLGLFTPHQIVREIHQESPAGKLFLKVIESGASHSSLEEVLRRFEEKAPQLMK
jgi:hypothetical protein